MKKIFFKYILFSIFTIFFLSQCSTKDSNGNNKFTEGTIKYKIEYSDKDKDKLIVTILPTEMTQKVKDKSYMYQLEGWLGSFRISYISDADKNLNASLLKYMGNKLCNEDVLTGHTYGFDSLPDFDIIKTKETKLIAGYKCKKATIQFKDTVNKSFDIFYTNDINVKNANWTNPFNEVDGVLLEWQVDMKGIRMLLTATEILHCEVSDKDFEIPTGYKRITTHSMDSIITNLICSMED